jgi:hypothetical protein
MLPKAWWKSTSETMFASRCGALAGAVRGIAADRRMMNVGVGSVGYESCDAVLPQAAAMLGDLLHDRRMVSKVDL